MFGRTPRAEYTHYVLGMCNEKEPQLTVFHPNLAWTSYIASNGSLGQPWQPGDVIHMSLDCDNHTLVARHERTGVVDVKTNVTGEIRLYLLTTCPQDQVTIL